MNSSFLYKYSIRFLMLIFWLTIILAYLYFPLVKDLLPIEDRKSINIYCWADVFDDELVKTFENETGIKINLSYYELNYELVSKLELTKGEGYDLIMATDFAVSYLKELNLLKKIDHSKLNFWNNLEENLLDRKFDKNNEYTLPYFWDIYVIGYNKKFYNQGLPAQGWSLIFDPKVMPNKIGMLEDANEAFMVSAQYLFNSTQNLTDEKLSQIKDLLIKQKPYVESYNDLRASNLILSGAAPISVAQSAYICRPMRFSKKVDFIVPKEGSFIVIDGFMISETTKKADYVYEFLNFIYQKQYVESITEKYCYLPARKDLLRENKYILGNYTQIKDYLSKALLFSSDVSLDKIDKLWMEIKSN